MSLHNCLAGRTRITLRNSGEVYTLVPPNAMVHNIVIGRTWVDAFGPMYIYCDTTGAYGCVHAVCMHVEVRGAACCQRPVWR